MKRFVDGVEVEVPFDPAAQVTVLSDRLMVRTSEGSFSAVSVRIGDAVHVSYRGRTFIVAKESRARRSQSTAASGEIRATMPGQIVDVFVKEGDKVASGVKIVVLEAMKTQQSFLSPIEGTVSKVGVAKGQQVSDGELLVLISAT